MRPAWWHALVALTAAVVAAFWPLTPALSSGDTLQARVGAALIAAIACGLLRSLRGTFASAASEPLASPSGTL